MPRTALVLTLLFSAATLQAATFVVTTNAASGAGSLHQAILDANANAGADAIHFAIGTGAQQITLASDLPAVTGPVSIDGTTQPGYAGTPLITISSQHAGTFTISGGSSTVRGLAFLNTRVLLQTGNDNVFAGNAVAGATGRCGVEITSSNNRIGGTTAADANRFDGNNGTGVCITGATAANNTVKGNRIVGNVISGVKVEGSANLIGGTEVGARNLISGNGGAGIELAGTQNRIEGNYIGVDTDGATALANGTRFAAGDRANIKVSGNGHTIGGLSFARRNIIAHGAPGIAFVSTSTQNVAILSNGMFRNLGKDIDLTNTPSQRLPNDALDADTGANGLQNHPQICKVVRVNGNTVTISGWLRSTPNMTFTIQLFSTNPGGGGCDSDTIVATFPVTTDANGDATFVGTYPGLWYVNFNATATDANNNTSEVSSCEQRCTEVSDFDGDGRSDIFWRNTATGQNTLWFMEGTTLRSGGDFVSAAPAWTPYLADFDGNDTTDIFWRNQTTGENGLWYIQHVRIIGGGGNIPTMAPEWEPLFGDFTGDRLADVLWRNVNTGAQQLWAGRGAGLEVLGPGPATAPGVWERRAGFINDDAFADVFWRNPATGENSLSFMNGPSVIGGANLPPVPDDWTPTLADSNGDGRADILWRNKNSGELTFWFLSGGRIIGGGNLWPVGTPWRMTRGDYDGNGRADIFWRSPVSGENTLWLLDGRTIIGGGNIPPVTAPNWVVIGQQ